MSKSEDFRQALLGFLFEAAKDGRPHVDVSAAQLHRALGGYPGPCHRMPICCAVMRTAMRPGDSILHAPPAGCGPSLTIRYFLPHSGS
jgi:5-methylcytosine-specific restriction protein A